MKVWPSKDPDEVLDYSYDWADDLEQGLDPEFIASAVFTVANAAGTVVDGESHGQTAFTAIISGGNDGEEASYTLRITTTKDRIFEDSIALPISSTIAAAAHPGDYSPVTPANLVWALPEFSTVPINRIRYFLTVASNTVDTSWAEHDYSQGVIYAAAHLMTMAGLGDTAEARAIANGSDQFRSIKVGSLALERFGQGGSARWAGSRYGARFLELLRVNKAGPRVSGGAFVGGYGAGDNFGPWTA